MATVDFLNEAELSFSEFIEFRESDKSLKHELDSIEGSCLLPVFYCIVVIP